MFSSSSHSHLARQPFVVTLRPLVTGGLLLALCACSSKDETGPADNNGGAGGTAGTAGTGGAGGTAAAGGAGGGTGLEYKPCPQAERVGGINVALNAESTSVLGQILDAVTPALIPNVEAEAAGCSLLSGRNLFCDPACDGFENVCDGKECIPIPAPHSVGTVTIQGFKEALSIEPAPKFWYRSPVGFPHPAFATGDGLTLQTTGGDYEPFTLRGEGIDLLELGEEVTIKTGEATEVTWKAPTEEGPAQIFIHLSINNHGSSSAWIDCNAPDTGSFTIPVELISGLMDLGVSGWPTITVIRRTADSTDLAPGCVDFTVGSERTVDVTVDGVISCSKENPCPDDMTCQADQTCG